MSQIHTLRSLQHKEGFTSFVQWFREERSRRGLPVPEAPRGRDAQHPPLTPRVNYGNWIIDCPFCPSATMADPDDLRFFCLDCSNEANGHKWVDVEWPENAAEVEAELLRRDKAANRNWTPGESIVQLQAETLLERNV